MKKIVVLFVLLVVLIAGFPVVQSALSATLVEASSSTDLNDCTPEPKKENPTATHRPANTATFIVPTRVPTQVPSLPPTQAPSKVPSTLTPSPVQPTVVFTAVQFTVTYMPTQPQKPRIDPSSTPSNTPFLLVEYPVYSSPTPTPTPECNTCVEQRRSANALNTMAAVEATQLHLKLLTTTPQK